MCSPLLRFLRVKGKDQAQDDRGRGERLKTAYSISQDFRGGQCSCKFRCNTFKLGHLGEQRKLVQREIRHKINKFTDKPDNKDTEKWTRPPQYHR